MPIRSLLSCAAGFFLLFAIYHFPEFFTSFWIMALFKTGFIVAAFFLARAQGWTGLGGYGLSLKDKWLRQLLVGLLLGLTFFILSFYLSVLLGYESIVPSITITTFVGQVPMLLLMTAVPSVAEDILTRGYLYAHLEKYMKPVHWALLSALVYVLNHIWRLGDGAAVLSYLLLLGLVLAYAVIITKSLWLAFGIHWGANIAYESTRSLFSTTSASSDASTWILAGCWGLLLVLLILWGFYRNRLKSGIALAPDLY
ncbi:CPBP family intramembrane glutamic endopeptidase [Pontibacter sp. BAB1700]|uniref:CPBP family intramembrane glutamic endopeptidase n=1 Tax=Pontibacter sp. BAB1700 TaxID=1144253 RepID=UPI00026BC1DB|nr:CPBP family intramembrane glutamic endopeptidase [Pontibacter sp. BAB1700]EJF09281.1 abortive infection protein [Pontibacter sp. BAB1700]